MNLAKEQFSYRMQQSTGQLGQTHLLERSGPRYRASQNVVIKCEKVSSEQNAVDERD